ncbi:MAG TPA: DNA-binding protein [Desulfotomaculum sp.]|jgi:Mn-dependent DtxR family transcriptional regulator|nr:DNA-binding protein [Desulfotomaculum sp.]
MLSPSLEDYLEEIFRFSLTNDVVRVSDIAACLNVSLPSVTNALRKLNNERYLTYKKYREVVLTAKGRKLGRFLVERNGILRDFLKVLGSDCNIAAEAEAMEHYLTRPTIRAVEHLVNFMHDNPECYEKFRDYTEKRKNNITALIKSESYQP